MKTVKNVQEEASMTRKRSKLSLLIGSLGHGRGTHGALQLFQPQVRSASQTSS